MKSGTFLLGVILIVALLPSRGVGEVSVTERQVGQAGNLSYTCDLLGDEEGSMGVFAILTNQSDVSQLVIPCIIPQILTAAFYPDRFDRRPGDNGGWETLMTNKATDSHGDVIWTMVTLNPKEKRAFYVPLSIPPLKEPLPPRRGTLSIWLNILPPGSPHQKNFFSSESWTHSMKFQTRIADKVVGKTPAVVLTMEATQKLHEAYVPVPDTKKHGSY